MDKRLENIGRRCAYRVPDGFFDDFERKMVAMTASCDAGSHVLEVAPRRRTWWPYAVAAMLVGVVALAAVNLTRNSVAQTPLSDVTESFENLSYDDQLAWIENYQEDVFFEEIP